MSTKKHPRIVVEVEGGMVSVIYGDPLPFTVEFIVRDKDNIAAGDPDPLLEHETFDNIVYHF